MDPRVHESEMVDGVEAIVLWFDSIDLKFPLNK